jgi:hypothetical protein
MHADAQIPQFCEQCVRGGDGGFFLLVWWEQIVVQEHDRGLKGV